MFNQKDQPWHDDNHGIPMTYPLNSLESGIYGLTQRGFTASRRLSHR